MAADKDRTLEAIEKGRDFIIAAHVQPDGDALGAALGISLLLKELGKNVVIAIDPDQIPAKYRFLPGIESVVRLRTFKGDTLIAVDVATPDRLGDSKAALKAVECVVNIDHHPDNPRFGTVNWVESETTSTSEMVMELWRAAGMTLTLDAAICIYVGMLTDTGNWQYSNTTSGALRAAADLMDLGVEPNKIFSRIYESNTTGWLRLMGLGLTAAVIDKDLRFAYAIVTRADLEVAGAQAAEVENLVDWLRSLADVEVVLVIKETKGGEFKGSVRSGGLVNVGALARLYDGGGHHNAAGFTTTEAPSLVVARVKKWLKSTASSL